MLRLNNKHIVIPFSGKNAPVPPSAILLEIFMTTPIFIPGNALLQYFPFSKALGARKGFTGKYHIFKICFVNF